jgi:hypothetical protein
MSLTRFIPIVPAIMVNGCIRGPEQKDPGHPNIILIHQNFTTSRISIRKWSGICWR